MIKGAFFAFALTAAASAQATGDDAATLPADSANDAGTEPNPIDGADKVTTQCLADANADAEEHLSLYDPKTNATMLNLECYLYTNATGFSMYHNCDSTKKLCKGQTSCDSCETCKYENIERDTVESFVPCAVYTEDLFRKSNIDTYTQIGATELLKNAKKPVGVLKCDNVAKACSTCIPYNEAVNKSNEAGISRIEKFNRTVMACDIAEKTPYSEECAEHDNLAEDCDCARHSLKLLEAGALEISEVCKEGAKAGLRDCPVHKDLCTCVDFELDNGVHAAFDEMSCKKISAKSDLYKSKNCGFKCTCEDYLSYLPPPTLFDDYRGWCERVNKNPLLKACGFDICVKVDFTCLDYLVAHPMPIYDASDALESNKSPLEAMNEAQKSFDDANKLWCEKVNKDAKLKECSFAPCLITSPDFQAEIESALSDLDFTTFKLDLSVKGVQELLDSVAASFLAFKGSVPLFESFDDADKKKAENKIKEDLKAFSFKIQDTKIGGLRDALLKGESIESTDDLKALDLGLTEDELKALLKNIPSFSESIGSINFFDGLTPTAIFKKAEKGFQSDEAKKILVKIESALPESIKTLEKFCEIVNKEGFDITGFKALIADPVGFDQEAGRAAQFVKTQVENQAALAAKSGKVPAPAPVPEVPPTVPQPVPEVPPPPFEGSASSIAASTLVVGAAAAATAFAF